MMASGHPELSQGGQPAITQEGAQYGTESSDNERQSEELQLQRIIGIWRLHWRSPASMVGLFIGATCAAIGHHLYYDSLDGIEVIVVTNEWNLQ